MAIGTYGKPVNISPVEFPEYTGPKLTPVGKSVHVQLDHTAFTSEAGLLVSGNSKKMAQVAQAKVLSVSPGIDDILPGDIVLVAQHRGSGNEGRVRKDGTMIIAKEHVLAVVSYE